MRAFLPGLAAAMMLIASLTPGAGAAKKRSARDSARPPQDSVLWVPRVLRPPDLETFLGEVGSQDRDRKKGRTAKGARDAGSVPDPSAPASAAAAASQADAAPATGAAGSSLAAASQATGSATAASVTVASATAASATAASAIAAAATAAAATAGAAASPVIASPEPAAPGVPESTPRDPAATESPSTGSGSAIAPSQAGAEIASPDSSETAAQTMAPAPPKLEPSGNGNLARPPDGPFSLETSLTAREDGAVPPLTPDPPAMGNVPSAPPGGPRLPARSNAGIAQEHLVLWLFAAFAGLFMVWTWFGWRNSRRRRTRNASDGLFPPDTGRDGRDGDLNGAAGDPAVIALHGTAGDAPAVASATAGAQRGSSRIRGMIVSNLWRVRGSLLVAVLFMVGGAAVELLKPWPLKVILDHVILAKPLTDSLSFLHGLPENGLNLLVAASLAIVAISVLGGMFSYLEVFITKAIGIRMVYALRREVFSHLQRLSLSFHNRARTGDLLTTFAKDTSTLKDVFAEALLKFADHFLSVAGMLVIMWWVNWKIALIALASLPFLGFTLLHLYRQTKLSLKKQRRQEGKVTSRMTEVLAAVPLVQAFGRERHEEERYEEISNETLRESIRMTRLEAAASRSSHIMTAMGTAGTVLFGGMEVLRGNMLPGELVLVMSYLSSMYKPVRQLAKLSIDFSKASASAERIAEVLEVEPEIHDLPDAIEADGLKGGIVFASVSFDYEHGRDVLRQVSFEVGPGQRLALVGVSGAGKSTIASLMLRLYEAQSGAILIDGVSIERYRRESLRRQIGIVLQQSVLFGATIRENIAYGKPDASEEEIVAAAKAANADEFIRKLEDGYDSVIGERGATLSAGQRQRIAIARAIIRDPRILILDEPMTGLDAESEHKVRQALDRLMAGKTAIMITHDLQSIADADQVLLLEDGRIAECGTHAELIRRSGRYRQLFDFGTGSGVPELASA